VTEGSYFYSMLNSHSEYFDCNLAGLHLHFPDVQCNECSN